MLIFEEGMTYGFARPEGATQCVSACSRLQAERPEKVASKGSGVCKGVLPQSHMGTHGHMHAHPCCMHTLIPTTPTLQY